MKVCPVCNESFGDEFSFCDIDGSRLERQRGAATTQDSNKMWSLLGVGLLVGGLVISAASIIFFPKSYVSPNSTNSVTTPAPTSNDARASEASNTTTLQADASEPEVIVEETPLAEPKKRDNALASRNGNSNVSSLNPKDAAQTDEEKAAARVENTGAAPPPEPKKPEMTAVKATSEARDSDKSSQTVSEPERDQKRQTVKNTDKDSDGKKKSDSEGKEKKKGGFLRVFKKIFGKG